ncbi:MAG: hypothetical protein HY069_02585 [Chlamydiia bacterium]|nr:hypothetical protein [Chlamydiia bacterium]
MERTKNLPYFPLKFLREGVIILGSTFLLAVLLLILLQHNAIFEMENDKKGRAASTAAYKIPLSLGAGFSCSLPNLREECSISVGPPHPADPLKRPFFTVKLMKSGAVQRLSLPCRIYLFYAEDEKLMFANGHAPFFVDFALLPSGEVEAKVSVEGFAAMQEQTYVLKPQESPLQALDELPAVMRTVVEGRWLGRDLFAEKYGTTLRPAERIEWGNGEILSLQEGEYWVWDQEKWKKNGAIDQNALLIRMERIRDRTLVLEGWDAEHHYRFAMPQPLPIPAKIRPEEFLTSIRVRSEKQMSCTLDKQCLILKAGDWVLKSEGKWRILRRPEEKEALQCGKLSGEIFVFDGIESKSNQKTVHGHLFNVQRSQCLPVDLAVHSMKTHRHKTRQK